jgi:multidrug efflux system membrane fusion protein
MRVACSIETGASENAVVIPRDLVELRHGQPHAFVVDRVASVVRLRRLSLGIQSDRLVEVLDGLEAGDLIVAGGEDRLDDGASIEVVAISP